MYYYLRINCIIFMTICALVQRSAHIYTHSAQNKHSSDERHSLLLILHLAYLQYVGELSIYMLLTVFQRAQCRRFAHNTNILRAPKCTRRAMCPLCASCMRLSRSSCRMLPYLYSVIFDNTQTFVRCICLWIWARC